MTITLKNRIDNYINITDYKILSKLPIIIIINGRNFSKTTSLLDKPFCNKFSECMTYTMGRLCIEVEGAIFAYCFNDEIVLILRNDQSINTEPWYDGRIQKICSITSSLATLYFNKYALSIDLNIINDSIFSSQAFVVPNIIEAINTIIYKQQQNFYSSIHNSCFYELLNKKYDKNSIKKMLMGLSIDDKIDLLKQTCDVEFNDYALLFRRGIACYKKHVLTDDGFKSKWSIDNELPVFSKEQIFLSNIFILNSKE